MVGLLYFFITFLFVLFGVIAREYKSNYNRKYKIDERYGVYVDARGMLRDVKTNVGPVYLGKDEFGLDAVLMNGTVIRRVEAEEKEKKFNVKSQNIHKSYPEEISVMKWGYISKKEKNDKLIGFVYRNLETGDYLVKRSCLIREDIGIKSFYVNIETYEIVGMSENCGNKTVEYVNLVKDEIDKRILKMYGNGSLYDMKECKIWILNSIENGETSSRIAKWKTSQKHNKNKENIYNASEKFKKEINIL